MQIYQMNRAQLLQAFECDLTQGLPATDNQQPKTTANRFLSRLRGYLGFLKNKFCYVDIVALLCYAVAVVFSCLDRRTDLLCITAFSMAITAALYLAQMAVLYRYKERYHHRISEQMGRVAVLRGGERVMISAASLLAGDLLILEPGTVLYADARVVSANDLYASEKTVFSSTIPAAKTADALTARNLPPNQQSNMLWKGSYISSGSGLAIVTALSDDCYVEKTGGRSHKKQRSFFYNRQNNVGHIYSFAFLILMAVNLLIAVLVSNRFLDAFLVMAAMSSLILLNPAACLTEWTYYRIADKMAARGVQIRNIEAFDGMNRESDLYYSADDLIRGHLRYQAVIPLRETEKSALSYFALCMGQSEETDQIEPTLHEFGLSHAKLSQNLPVFRSECDAQGNRFRIFVNQDRSVTVAAGYWKNMLPYTGPLSESLAAQIADLDAQGRFVYLLCSNVTPSIPGNLDVTAFIGRMEQNALIVFDVAPNADIQSMISQLKHTAMTPHLIHSYSEPFGAALARAYAVDSILSSPPEKSSYSIPACGNGDLLVRADALPADRERANVLLPDGCTPQELIYQVKCMFCGLRRCLNFLSVFGILLITTILPLFFQEVPLKNIIYPLFLLRVLLILPCYYLIESVGNCTQHRRSLLLGAFCGASMLLAALLHSDMALFTAGFSSVLLSAFLFYTSFKFRKRTRKDFILLVCAAALAVVPWILIGSEWIVALLLSFLPPLGAFLLNLFY